MHVYVYIYIYIYIYRERERYVYNGITYDTQYMTYDIRYWESAEEEQKAIRCTPSLQADRLNRAHVLMKRGRHWDRKSTCQYVPVLIKCCMVTLMVYCTYIRLSECVCVCPISHDVILKDHRRISERWEGHSDVWSCYYNFTVYTAVGTDLLKRGNSTENVMTKWRLTKAECLARNAPVLWLSHFSYDLTNILYYVVSVGRRRLRAPWSTSWPADTATMTSPCLRRWGFGVVYYTYVYIYIYIYICIYILFSYLFIYMFCLCCLCVYIYIYIYIHILW